MAATFPFLTGCERSGTTMLRAMVDAHPQVAVPDESHFLPTLAARRHDLEQGGTTIHVERLVALLHASPGFRRWGLDRGEVTALLHRAGPRDLAAAVRLLYAIYARRHGKSRYADKTTTYVFALPAIAAVLPEARFVHLIRDGRNVALSLLQVPWGPRTVEEAAVWWRVRVEAAREGGALLGPRRYTEVRFEDLAAAPDLELGRVTDFFEIPWDPAMLRYHDQSSAGILERMPEKRRQAHDNLRRPPTATLRDWRRELPAPSQLAFEALAGDLLEELGYERRFSSVAVIASPDERRALIDRQRRRVSA